MTPVMLKELWQSARTFPGWLSVWIDIGISEADANAMSDIDSSHRAALGEINKAWIRNYKRPEVDPAWARERRKEYLSDELPHLRRRLMVLRIEAARETDRTISCMIADKISIVSGEIRKAASELDGIDKWRSDSRVSGVDQGMIDRARAYPIREIIKTDKDMVSCPLHQDKRPSASIKKGFLHCFSCGENLDAIGYLMQVEGLDFVSAVRRLQ